MTNTVEVQTGVFVTYDSSSAPVKSVRVSNPKGYLDRTYSVDTTPSGKRRIKVETGNGAIFIAAKRGESLTAAVEKHVAALDLLLENGIDSSVAA